MMASVGENYMEEKRPATSPADLTGKKTAAFRNVLMLTERVEERLRRGDTDGVGALLDERQVWMDRINAIDEVFLRPSAGEKTPSPFPDLPAEAKTDDEARRKTAELIRSCIEKNIDILEILQAACARVRKELDEGPSARPAAFIGYPDARNGIPRFVDVRS